MPWQCFNTVPSYYYYCYYDLSIPQDKNTEELDIHPYSSWHYKCFLIHGNVCLFFIYKILQEPLGQACSLSSSTFNFIIHEKSFWTHYLSGSSSISKSYQRHKARNTNIHWKILYTSILLKKLKLLLNISQIFTRKQIVCFSW